LEEAIRLFLARRGGDIPPGHSGEEREKKQMKKRKGRKSYCVAIGFALRGSRDKPPSLKKKRADKKKQDQGKEEREDKEGV